MEPCRPVACLGRLSAGFLVLQSKKIGILKFFRVLLWELVAALEISPNFLGERRIRFETHSTKALGRNAAPCPAQLAGVHPAGLSTLSVEAGNFSSLLAGRRGRATSSPPQLGQWPCSTVSAQVLQKVHSKEQMRASAESGGRSLSQHSQLGLSASMAVPFFMLQSACGQRQAHSQCLRSSQRRFEHRCLRQRRGKCGTAWWPKDSAIFHERYRCICGGSKSGRN